MRLIFNVVNYQAYNVGNLNPLINRDITNVPMYNPQYINTQSANRELSKAKQVFSF